MCAHVYICARVCVFVFMCTHMRVYVCMHVHIRLGVHVKRESEGEQDRKRDGSLALMLTYRFPDAH